MAEGKLGLGRERVRERVREREWEGAKEAYSYRLLNDD